VDSLRILYRCETSVSPRQVMQALASSVVLNSSIPLLGAIWVLLRAISLVSPSEGTSAEVR
jgi:hypothetical protein